MRSSRTAAGTTTAPVSFTDSDQLTDADEPASTSTSHRSPSGAASASGASSDTAIVGRVGGNGLARSDRRDAREVGADGQADLDQEILPGTVDHGEGLAHALRDNGSVAPEPDRRIPSLVAEAAQQPDEVRARRPVAAVRDRLRLDPVDGDDRVAEHPHVTGEHALGVRSAQLAVGPGEADVRSTEGDRQIVQERLLGTHGAIVAPSGR